jgi:hypothetical protein
MPSRILALDSLQGRERLGVHLAPEACRAGVPWFPRSAPRTVGGGKHSSSERAISRLSPGVLRRCGTSCSGAVSFPVVASGPLSGSLMLVSFSLLSACPSAGSSPAPGLIVNRPLRVGSTMSASPMALAIWNAVTNAGTQCAGQKYWAFSPGLTTIAVRSPKACSCSLASHHKAISTIGTPYRNSFRRLLCSHTDMEPHGTPTSIPRNQGIAGRIIEGATSPNVLAE